MRILSGHYNSGAPDCVPLLGHVPAFMRDPLGFFTQCARHYGDWAPIKFGPRKFFAASHPDLIEQVSADRVEPAR